MRTTYEDYRTRADAEYADEFREWVAHMTPAQLAKLRACGIALARDKQGRLNGAQREGGSSGVGLEHDAAELPAASYRVDIGTQVDTLADEIGSMFELPQQTSLPLAAFMVRAIETRSIKFRAALLMKLCGAFIDGRNPKLLAAGLAFAANLAALNGLKTQRQHAKKIGVTPAALSKVTKFWQEELELAVSPHMKSAAACGAYSRVQKGDAHWRKQKVGMKALLPYMSAGSSRAEPITNGANGAN